MAPPRISKLTFGRNSSPIGIGQSRPTLSWRYEQDDSTEPNWTQKGYELSFSRSGGNPTTYQIDSGENIEIPWPKDEPPLSSRERVEVKIRAKGETGWTEWYRETVEAALLDESDWVASTIAPDVKPPSNLTKRPFYVQNTFTLDSVKGDGRIYATALGVYEISINGVTIGDHVLAPGWQSYKHRLHYQTYSIPEGVLVQGNNSIEVIVGEGWYSGRLTWLEVCRNLWGEEIGVMIQVEVGGKPVATSGNGWEWSYGALLASELYDGETYDVDIGKPNQWQATKTISLPTGTTLIAPEAPPIRRIEMLKPKERLTSPSRKTILDFGQNLVGWVKVHNVPAKAKMNECITLRFAEVLDKGELGVRPLRSAKATDKIFLGDQGLKEWEPKFTTHGFRYCEVTGPASLLDGYEDNFTAVVVHSDIQRIGDFECSHAMINQLHRNVVWGLKGNFVGLPTDCPQRDERLGWTGDLQAFAPTASFLYDTSGFLANWLHDLSEEQLKDNQGVVPLVVPNALKRSEEKPLPQAVWGDVCVITPKDLYLAYGSKEILREMWNSMTIWLDKGIPRGENGLWHNPRNGLDPRAPPDDPGAAMTDQYLVADAYLVAISITIAKIAETLGLQDEVKKYTDEHRRLRKAFQDEYLASSGRLSSDTQTAYCLAFQFELLDSSHLQGAAERLLRLVTRDNFRIATGFAGTPGILHALTQAGHLQVAYRMLQEKGCPSWLYPVTMQATTIWERWDSLLPDGSINPGEMTSFNHYALGAVANFLHTTVGGLRPLDPGYRKFIVQPRPGGTITNASVHTITPSGRAAVSWTLKDGVLKVQIEVPPNTTALLRLGREEESVGSGKHSREIKYRAEGVWPPPRYQTPFAVPELAGTDTLAE
ncbi:bacterial alpha-L-rhamnosidase-domain-containing protein [Naematelia encephala]|uniref:alpha-L-rhamnosidase n=1 Tax=Naematelia encephala TaxID=71784 RepID=A0A1Y2B8C5_9TREE|nr:bacterial alpha-L-rhamnosidase-domain-containing protein [Naematelia encephala]